MWKIRRRRPQDESRTLESLFADQELPHFPRAAAQVLRMLRDPNASSERIAEVAQWDAGLVVQILRAVNCAALGARTEIRSVPHAVTYLGRSKLESLVLALAVKDLLPRRPSPRFCERRFWRTAGWRASLARILSQRLTPQLADEHFLCGLLQDIGLPILAQSLPEEYDPLLGTWLEDPTAHLHVLERETLGFDHTGAGGLFAKHLGLPKTLSAVILDHHRHEGDSSVHPAVDLAAHLREEQEDAGVALLLDRASEHYGLSRPWVEEAVVRAKEQGAELGALLG